MTKCCLFIFFRQTCTYENNNMAKMYWFQRALLASELIHSFLHFIVLTNIHSLTLGGSILKLYFIWDAASSMMSYFVTKKNKRLVIVHMMLHLPALAHLFDIYSTSVYAYVFNQAYHNNTTYGHPIYSGIYYVGTCVDIYCHLHNVRYLLDCPPTRAPKKQK